MSPLPRSLYAGGESGLITFSGHEPHEHTSLSLTTPDIVRAKKSADNKSRRHLKRRLEWARYTSVYLRSFLAISHFSLHAPRTWDLFLGRMFEFPVGISFSLAYYSPASIFAFIFPCMHAFSSVYPRQPPYFDSQSLPGHACNRRPQYCTHTNDYVLRPPGGSHAFPIFKSSVLFYLFVSLHVCGRAAGKFPVAHLKQKCR